MNGAVENLFLAIWPRVIGAATAGAKEIRGRSDERLPPKGCIPNRVTATAQKSLPLQPRPVAKAARAREPVPTGPQVLAQPMILLATAGSRRLRPIDRE
jgi:hypothetical protein